MKKEFLRFTLFLLVYLSIRVTATAQMVDIPDPNLRDYIERVLNKAAGSPINVTEMAALTSIDLQEAVISDLTGLDHAINLTELHLYNNSISDISAVAGLIHLTRLVLRDNPISDISPVAGLTNLTELGFQDNSISDISPLAGLTNLTSLGLAENSISDISPVAGLTNLTFLHLGDNSISDISAVVDLTNLTGLFLQDNSISDISPVAGLTNLAWLRFSDNLISDISAVAGLTNLMGLFLNSNSISDITAVTGLTNLVSLDLSYNMVFDLSPLVANTGLGAGVGVFVEGNPLNSLSLRTHIPTLRERGVNVWSAETELLWNYPNPFRLETWIPYRLAEDAFVTLTIYDLSGHVIRTLEAGHQIAGTYASRYKAAYWDGRNELGERIASGTYFYHLSAGDSSITRRMVILR